MTTDLQTEKIYIGQHHVKSEKTFDPWYLGCGNVVSGLIKERPESLTRDILAFCDCKEDAYTLEEFFIKVYDATNPEVGYNLLEGIRDGWRNSGFTPGHATPPAWRRASSLANKGKHPSNHTREKLSIFHRTQIRTPEWRANISKALKGKKFSEEWSKKQSIAHKGNNHAGKAIKDVTTGNIYKSVASAARSFGRSHGYLVTCLRQGKKCWGHEWEYIKE